MDIVKSMLDDAPINIEAIIRSLGQEVVKDADLPADISGQIKKLPDGRYELSSSAGEHYYRQRFSLAHELGHYILHNSLIGAGLDDNTKYRSTSEGNYYNTAIELAHERQANSFAASVLMPEKLVRKAIDEANGDVSLSDLYRKFQVSASAMNWRLRNLGLTKYVKGAG
ncbi:ImmA/IrrE family metallo-endopeptidase [Ruegeria arenilitoris]|uniref:ImmA/IrrE family metallo-endopeptidase n=1 Tax=Ruegeria arenilitoris TaxID=1173585 RepID=UPI00147B38D8|nr:ImmA/IrrE family metallo-endopeptidase [Ruegeria arenilitoris]